MKRDKNLDLLRVIASFMVVVIHVSAPYVISNLENPNVFFTVGNFFDSISRVGVPIFIMLSGSFVLKNNKNKNIKLFYKKSIHNIVVPTLIWSFIYVLYLVSRQYIGLFVVGRTPQILPHIKNWILGVPYYHLWYMYMIFGLYAISPILIRVKDKLGEYKTLLLGVGLLILGMIIQPTIKLYWPIQFVIYLGYFILGYSLREYYEKNNKSPFKYLIIFFISFLAVFLITEILARMNFTIANKLYFYNYLSPFVIIGAISLFIAFITKPATKLNVEKFSRHSFRIYLIHAGVLTLISEFITALKCNPNPIWFIPIVSVIVFLVSYNTSLLISKFSPMKI